MIDNLSLIQKADLALSELTTEGGVLQPAQARRFIRIMIKSADLLPLTTFIPMRAPKQLLEKTRFGSRILRAGVSGEALAVQDRSKPDLSKVELDAKLFKAEVRLNDEILEDNIERQNFKNTVMEMMAEALARDVDDVLINGDTTSPDPFYSQFDGLLVSTTSNVVNAGGINLQKSVLKAMIQAMPTEFMRDRRRARFLTSVNAEVDLRDLYADRATAVGDTNLLNMDQIRYSSIPVVPISLFPEDLGVGNDETNAILVNPKNINVGWWRQMKMATQRDVPAGTMAVVASMRFDFKYTEETAAVKATEILVG
jgi:HK97 family phage major capsid protein